MSRWVRNEPERRDDLIAGLAAGATGVVVGAAVFWLVRLLVAREPLPEGEAYGLPAEASEASRTSLAGRGDEAGGGTDRASIRAPAPGNDTGEA